MSESGPSATSETGSDVKMANTLGDNEHEAESEAIHGGAHQIEAMNRSEAQETPEVNSTAETSNEKDYIGKQVGIDSMSPEDIDFSQGFALGQPEFSDGMGVDGQEKDLDTNINDADVEENDNNVQGKSNGLRVSAVKKPFSAWLYYSMENREKVRASNPDLAFAEVAQKLGEGYRNISSEEKEKYLLMAVKDKARYTQELAAAKAYEATLAPPEENDSALFTGSDELVIPLARIKRTIKMDPDVKNVSKEALTAVARCTELFTALIARHALKEARLRNRDKDVKSIRPLDIINAIHDTDVMDFLRMDYPKPKAVEKVKPVAVEPTKEEKQKTAEEVQKAVGTKAISSFFSTSETGTGGGGWGPSKNLQSTAQLEPSSPLSQVQATPLGVTGQGAQAAPSLGAAEEYRIAAEQRTKKRKDTINDW